MRVPPMHVTADLMPCPACGTTITAQIEVHVTLTAKERVGNVVPVDAATSMSRFNVRHECSGPTAAAHPDPEEPAMPEHESATEGGA